jgi:hypothetical protein
MPPYHAENQTYDTRTEESRHVHVLRSLCDTATHTPGEGGTLTRGRCRSTGNDTDDHLSLGIWRTFPEGGFTPRNRQSLKYQGSDTDARSLEKEFSEKFTNFVNTPIYELRKYGKMVSVTLKVRKSLTRKSNPLSSSPSVTPCDGGRFFYTPTLT